MRGGWAGLVWFEVASIVHGSKGKSQRLRKAAQDQRNVRPIIRKGDNNNVATN